MKAAVRLGLAFLFLAAGLFIYLSMRPGSIVAVFFRDRLGICMEGVMRIPEPLGTFVSYHLADMLWAGALMFCVSLILGNALIKAAFVSVMFCAFTEICQLLGWMSGTFDPADILLEAVSVAFCFMIIKLVDKEICKNE